MLSLINEVDPCLLLPLCVLYEIQNQIFQQLEYVNNEKCKVFLYRLLLLIFIPSFQSKQLESESEIKMPTKASRKAFEYGSCPKNYGE